MPIHRLLICLFSLPRNGAVEFRLTFDGKRPVSSSDVHSELTAALLNGGQFGIFVLDVGSLRVIELRHDMEGHVTFRLSLLHALL